MPHKLLLLSFNAETGEYRVSGLTFPPLPPGNWETVQILSSDYLNKIFNGSLFEIVQIINLIRLNKTTTKKK